MDERILHLLNNSTEYKETQFIKHNPALIRNASKRLAELITKSLQANTPIKSNYISFLQELRLQHNNHFNVNENNYTVYLNRLLIGNECEYIREIKNTPPNAPTNEIYQFYERKFAKQQLKEERLDRMREHDKESFKYLIYKPFRRIGTVEITKQIINCLNITSNKICEEINYGNANRESVIKLGYAIVHLNPKNKNNLIKKIISQLHQYSTRFSYEKEFIKFLFDKEDEQRMELLKLFPFLIESPILELSIDLLDDIHINFNQDARIKCLLDIIKANCSLKYLILAIIYKLFALSNYQHKFVPLIDYFHTSSIYLNVND